MRLPAALLLFLLLLGLALAAYGPALTNPLLFDDHLLIETNGNFTWGRLPDLLTPEYFDFFPGKPVSYRPLSTLTYIVNRQVWGDDYAFWRLFYLLWHTLNAFLLVLLFRRSAPLPLALLGSVFFLLHPVHSEAVNHFSYNEDVMMTTFLLLSWLFFLSARAGNGRWTGPASVAAFLLALLSKETALLYPLVPAAWTACTRPSAGGTRPGRGSGLTAALAAAALLFAVLRFGVMTNPSEYRRLEPSATALLSGLPESLHVLFDSIRRLFWPGGLSAVYDFGGSTWGDAEVIGGAAAAILACALILAGIRRRRPGLAVPAVWFLSGLTPLGYGLLFPWNNYAYDHYLYSPSIGLVWYAVLATALLAGRASPFRRPVPAWIVMAAFLPWFFLAIQERNSVWSSNLALWSDAAGRAPKSALAQYNLAFTLHFEGRAGEAADRYRKVLEIEPRHHPAWYNLTRLAIGKGDAAGAERAFFRALATDPRLEGRGEGERITAALETGDRYRGMIPALAGLALRASSSGTAEKLLGAMDEAGEREAAEKIRSACTAGDGAAADSGNTR